MYESPPYLVVHSPPGVAARSTEELRLWMRQKKQSFNVDVQNIGNVVQ
jgi:hypothetical protein